MIRLVGLIVPKIFKHSLKVDYRDMLAVFGVVLEIESVTDGKLKTFDRI
jgi:hypothetical protein